MADAVNFNVNPFRGDPMEASRPNMTYVNPLSAANSKDFATEKTDSGTGSFGNMMNNMLQELNDTVTKPDELMVRNMETGDVDYHEVMIANAKADIAVNMASQIVTKVIQAYERIQQIQV